MLYIFHLAFDLSFASETFNGAEEDGSVDVIVSFTPPAGECCRVKWLSPFNK